MVSSVVYFCVYLDGLLCYLCKLQASGIGCGIYILFTGVLANADYIALLAHTVHAMRCMPKLCDDYANAFSIMFNQQNRNVLLLRRLEYMHILSQSCILVGMELK